MGNSLLLLLLLNAQESAIASPAAVQVWCGRHSFLADHLDCVVLVSVPKEGTVITQVELIGEGRDKPVIWKKVDPGKAKYAIFHLPKEKKAAPVSSILRGTLFNQGKKFGFEEEVPVDGELCKMPGRCKEDTPGKSIDLYPVGGYVCNSLLMELPLRAGN